jgi:hypothetical protein
VLCSLNTVTEANEFRMPAPASFLVLFFSASTYSADYDEIYEIYYWSSSQFLSTGFGFVGCRSKVKLSLFCKMGQPSLYTFYGKRNRADFKETYPYCNSTL